MTPELIKQFEQPGPRYTSYPTADRFVDAFGLEDYVCAIEERKTGVGRSKSLPLSLYIHIPFCESLCYYCACNKIVTKHHERAQQYLHYLAREIDYIVDYLGAGKSINQLHLGGGTPTFFNDAELEQLMTLIRSNFWLMPLGEHAIEVDPRTVDGTRLKNLARLGFNRLSFGVQDFDLSVQQAIHRIQSFEQVQSLVIAARKIGFQSINVDLISGLPKQSVTSFDRTLTQVIALRPDRIAVYAYAHLPERFKPQRRIDVSALPNVQTKLEIQSLTIDRLVEAGYDYIGMDHFALHHDSLAQAKREGRLHRNFQGYSTQPDCDMIGLGVSAIGKMGTTYSQNAKVLNEYYDSIDQGRLPIVKGLSLSRDDVLRRAVIMAIMCQGRVDFEAIDLAYLIQFQTYFSKEMVQLEQLQARGLVTVTSGSLEVTDLGWFFVRGIAMVFDRYLQANQARTTFSKII